MKNRILTLTLKKKWFDMILTGKKKEEYREVKDYWMKRIAGINGCGTGYNYHLLALAGFNEIKKDIDIIVFKNGYSKNAPMIEVVCKGVVVGVGKRKWGAPDYRIFVLKLGEIIRTENIKGSANFNINQQRQGVIKTTPDLTFQPVPKCCTQYRARQIKKG